MWMERTKGGLVQMAAILPGSRIRMIQAPVMYGGPFSCSTFAMSIISLSFLSYVRRLSGLLSPNIYSSVAVSFGPWTV